MEFHHVPVLARQCMDALAIRPDGVYVDGTTGGGGHSSLIAQRLGEAGRLVCIDPVSYTHLDVYKRQPCHSFGKRRTSCRLCPACT